MEDEGRRNYKQLNNWTQVLIKGNGKIIGGNQESGKENNMEEEGRITLHILEKAIEKFVFTNNRYIDI